MEFYYENQKYNEQTFADTLCNGDLAFAKKVIGDLKIRHKIIDLGNQESTAQRTFNKDQATQAEYNEAENHSNAEEAEEYFIRDKKAQNQPRYEEITFDFYNLYTAQEFEQQARQLIKTMKTEIEQEEQAFHVNIFDITSTEGLQLEALYKTKNIVNKTVKTADKLTGAVANAVSFTGTNILAPLTKIGFKGAGKLLKGIIGTTAKIGGSLITTTTDAITETISDVKADPEVLKAKVAVKKKFDDLRGIKNNIGYGSSGVHYR